MTAQTVLNARVQALRSALAEGGLDGAVLSRPEHIFFFTGVLPGPAPAFLIVLPAELRAVATAAIAGCDTITYAAYDIRQGWSVAAGAGAALERALAGSPLADRTVGAELDHLPARYSALVQSHTGAMQDLADVLWRLRCRKDAAELAQIEANVAANDRLFAAVQAAIAPGVEDNALWALIYEQICRAAGEPIALEADLGVGARSDNPDAKPCGARLSAGDIVFVDVYSSSHGYYADTTRVFTVGQSSSRQRDLHAILEDALEAGEAVLRPGVPANAVDAAVRGCIERAGYGERFPHHSGHAYGLFQQERPYLIPAEPMLLEEGMVLTLEPGIYISGWGGMRLESSYVLEGAGARRLDHFPRRLAVCDP